MASIQCTNSLSETTAAYIAGIIDGEGCVEIGRLRRRSRYYPRLMIGQAEPRWALLDYLVDHLPGAKVYGPHRRTQTRARSKIVFWTNHEAVNALGMVRQFLILKGPQADLLEKLDRITDKYRQRGRIRWTSNLVATAMETYNECAAMNRRGHEEDVALVDVKHNESFPLFEQLE